MMNRNEGNDIYNGMGRTHKLGGLGSFPKKFLSNSCLGIDFEAYCVTYVVN